jgi:hypothetical protein
MGDVEGRGVIAGVGRFGSIHCSGLLGLQLVNMGNI